MNQWETMKGLLHSAKRMDGDKCLNIESNPIEHPRCPDIAPPSLSAHNVCEQKFPIIQNFDTLPPSV